jgi:hypothetical protein
MQLLLLVAVDDADIPYVSQLLYRTSIVIENETAIKEMKPLSTTTIIIIFRKGKNGAVLSLQLQV